MTTVASFILSHCEFEDKVYEGKRLTVQDLALKGFRGSHNSAAWIYSMFGLKYETEKRRIVDLYLGGLFQKRGTEFIIHVTGTLLSLLTPYPRCYSYGEVRCK